MSFLPARATGEFQLRCAGCRTAAFGDAKKDQDQRDEAEEIRLLYVAATRAERHLVIPWFKETGERLDLLARGFQPEASDLVEVDLGGAILPVATGNDCKRGACATDLLAGRLAWQTERTALLARAAVPAVRVSPSKLAHEAEPHEEEPVGGPRAAAMELVGKADEVYRELPFAVGSLEGKIDLLFREGKKWVLVDYKTDAQPDAERYRAQMQAYATALQQVAGIVVAEQWLFFLRTGEMVSLA